MTGSYAPSRNTEPSRPGCSRAAVLPVGKASADHERPPQRRDPGRRHHRDRDRDRRDARRRRRSVAVPVRGDTRRALRHLRPHLRRRLAPVPRPARAGRRGRAARRQSGGVAGRATVADGAFAAFRADPGKACDAKVMVDTNSTAVAVQALSTLTVSYDAAGRQGRQVAEVRGERRRRLGLLPGGAE
ncbi:hypothetical protein ACRAWF_14420 [Streptomyces sp. L7]